MTNHWSSSLTRLTDEALLARVQDLAHRERRATVALIAHLGELDERRLYLDEGCSSLFTYCTEILHFSEHAAYNRIECARAARRFPLVLDRLAEGSVHLTAVRLLSPHLTADNHAELLDRARHLGKRGVETIIAEIRPLPDAPSVVRRLPVGPVPSPMNTNMSAAPASSPVGTEGAPRAALFDGAPVSELPKADESRDSASPAAPASPPTSKPATLIPLAPERYRVQFTADEEMHADLLAAQELLRHQVPNGDPAKVLKMALKLLVRELRRKKFAATNRPRRHVCGNDGSQPEGNQPTENPRNSRHIPADVRREVARRDANRCAFRSQNGRRCSAHGHLEFHHLEPYAVGGRATIDNISLRCRAHNVHEAGGSVVRETAVPYDSPSSRVANSFRNEFTTRAPAGVASAHQRGVLGRPRAAGLLRSIRSRSAANARQARMSSPESDGYSVMISASVSPLAR